MVKILQGFDIWLGPGYRLSDNPIGSELKPAGILHYLEKDFRVVETITVKHP